VWLAELQGVATVGNGARGGEDDLGPGVSQFATAGGEDTSELAMPALTAGRGGRLYEFREPRDQAAGMTFLLFSKRKCGILPVGNQNGGAMKQKTDVLQGTLALMVLKTLDVLGPLHGYGVARRIEQISGDLLAVNQGTLYPVLLRLEQEGAIASAWGASENNRRARFYRLTEQGRKQLQVETQGWEQTAAIIGRFFEAKAEDLS
jgi:PadR family transcriptional regulator PadR